MDVGILDGGLSFRLGGDTFLSGLRLPPKDLTGILLAQVVLLIVKF